MVEARPGVLVGEGRVTFCQVGAQCLWLAAFLERLHELGWFEARNLVIEYRWANGGSDRAAEFAASSSSAVSMSF